MSALARGARRGMYAAVMLAALAPARARAQEFAAADGLPLAGSAFELVEHALPPARSGVALEALTLTRSSLPELGTRALAARAGWRGLRVAAAVASTGDPEIGWNTAAFAIGAGSPRAGGAVRAAARRDRHPEPRPTPVGAGVGLEAGAGAWAEALPGVWVWASAPALATRGEPPPLARSLEVGARFDWPVAQAWLARASAAGEHRAGVALSAGPASVWLEARDRPLRGAAGVRASIGPVAVAAGIESHPVLGELARVSLGIGGGP